MSLETLTLTSEFDRTLVLVSEEDTCWISLQGGADLVLELAAVIVVGGGGSGPEALKVDSTTITFGASSPVAMFSAGAGDVVDSVDVIVDTAFNGAAPQLSVGVSGTPAKYVAASKVNLKAAGIYQVHPGLPPQGVEALIATFIASGSSTGSARVLVRYATPS